MQLNENFITRKPTSKFLARYIDYFYFHSATKTKNVSEFIFYPNPNLALSIYKNSRVFLDKNISQAVPDLNQPFDLIYSGLRTESIKVELTEPFDKIGIVFKPLGINHFLPTSFTQAISPFSDIRIPYFETAMLETCHEIYQKKHAEEKVKYLEKFFVDNFYGFQEDRIVNAVNLIRTAKENISVGDVCLSLNMNRKTVLRLFREHLNCTIKEYIDIVQFRNALNLYKSIDTKPQLTQIAYESGYYDQSEFIKHFKKVTGYNPKKVFQDLDHLGTEGTFWTTLKKM